MKTMLSAAQSAQYNSKCVCQTCTCHKHRCPTCEIHVPFQQCSSYQNDYHKHPINTWQKPPAQQPRPYQPYGNVSSSYKTSYPGYKPNMRQKHVPRVKNQDKNVPFDGQSEYKNRFPAKSVPREPINNKDKLFVPMNQPFDGDTTYKTSYIKKQTNPHEKNRPVDYNFPPGYKFNGETTYGKSYDEKPLVPSKSCKPVQSINPTGPHDLNSIYRKDFNQKRIPEPCPILKMPQRASKVSQVGNHLVFDSNTMSWQQK